jgi:ligand-binding SRPBCC domain-containing protein
MRFPLQGQPPSMAAGAAIDYRVRVGPLPVRWRTRINHPGARPKLCRSSREGSVPLLVAPSHISGQADGPRTVMEDRVYYTPPLGLFGRLANRVFIRSTLRKIFQYRGDVIRLRFGVVA